MVNKFTKPPKNDELINKVNEIIDNLITLPSQSGNEGKFLSTNGNSISWKETAKITIRDWSVS